MEGKVTFMSNLNIKTFLVITISLFLFGASLPPVFAASLWTDAGPGASLYSDRRAHTIGDIITIIISEASTASRTGSANNSKTTNVAMNAGTGIFSPITSASAGNSDSFKASGAITNANTVTGRLTVTVTEIKPNGNLIISGTQSIKQNGEEQKITVSGEVRPYDISADNTVLSSFVANAQIKIDGKGPLAGKQRQGILSQIWNFLF